MYSNLQVSVSLVKTYFICSSIERCNFNLSFLILSKLIFISFTCNSHAIIVRIADGELGAEHLQQRER